jgi:hypothetical protein
VHRYLAATLDGFVNELDAVFEAKFMLPWSFSEEAAAENRPIWCSARLHHEPPSRRAHDGIMASRSASLTTPYPASRQNTACNKVLTRACRPTSASLSPAVSERPSESLRPTVGKQTRVRGHDRTAKLEHPPAVEIEHQRLVVRFTRRTELVIASVLIILEKSPPS